MLLMNRRKSTSKARYVATAAMVTALCCVILSLGTVFETMDLSFAAISALVIWIVLLEFGKTTAWSAYIATGLISMLLIPSKYPALFFICITGWYPMIKLSLSKRFKKKPLQWFFKLAIFNISAIASVVVIYFFGELLGISMGEKATRVYLIITLSTANFAFIITDILMDKLVIVYIYKLRDKLKKLKLIE